MEGLPSDWGRAHEWWAEQATFRGRINGASQCPFSYCFSPGSVVVLSRCLKDASTVAARAEPTFLKKTLENLLSARGSNRRVSFAARRGKEGLMTRQLPSKPSLEQLRKQAKDIHKAHKKADPSCCAVLRHLKSLADKPDADILKAEVSLRDVQFALAMEYGFKSWMELKETVSDNGRLSVVPDLARCLAEASRDELPLTATQEERDALLQSISGAILHDFDSKDSAPEVEITSGHNRGYPNTVFVVFMWEFMGKARSLWYWPDGRPFELLTSSLSVNEHEESLRHLKGLSKAQLVAACREANDSWGVHPFMEMYARKSQEANEEFDPAPFHSMMLDDSLDANLRRSLLNLIGINFHKPCWTYIRQDMEVYGRILKSPLEELETRLVAACTIERFIGSLYIQQYRQTPELSRIAITVERRKRIYPEVGRMLADDATHFSSEERERLVFLQSCATMCARALLALVKTSHLERGGPAIQNTLAQIARLNLIVEPDMISGIEAVRGG